jgi:tRNA C32,U32 (ribose-2'-O)-methylase TrmJ
MVLSYEIRKAALLGENRSKDDDWDQPLVTVEDMEGFFGHLERVLTRIEVLDPKAPRQLMTRLRRLYTRIRPDRMEINILRGVLTATESQLDKMGEE